ncbi:hypothetical protein [Actinomadura luteofluorescens]|uniref:hypothetical protein n=1 Tax=Actinomadura luteofluorescens TaxID=46163 RepID=UPI003BAE8D60
MGTKRNANNVLRSFRAVLAKTDLNPDEWTPRELRHSFVSVLSDAGVPHRGDLTAGRPQEHRGHRDGLLAPDPARAAGRRRGHGRRVPRGCRGRLVRQCVRQSCRRPTASGRDGPLRWSRLSESNR